MPNKPAARLHRLDDTPREKMMERVERRFLSGERCTLAQVWLTRGAVVPSHIHDSEQISYVLVIPSRVAHAAEALEDTYDLDFFAPRRDDWISGDDAYLRGKTSARG